MTTHTETSRHNAQIDLIADAAPAKPGRARKPRQAAPAAAVAAVAAAPEALVQPQQPQQPQPQPEPVAQPQPAAPGAQVIQLVQPLPPAPVDEDTHDAVIKVIGVGGGGGNAVAHMIQSGLGGVEFIVANTDIQALRKTGAAHQLPIGRHVTKRLGAGMVPETGRQAALEDKDPIKDALAGADMVFIAAGMGGGTGTGAAPIIAQLAKELDILTVAVVTKPFSFEGRKKMQVAQGGIQELAQHCDSLITIPNDKILATPGRKVGFLDAFRLADEVLLNAVRGIYDLIVRPGFMNVDFADVRTVMAENSLAMMGTGRASGDDRAQAALEAAIQNPLLDDINIAGATGILVNVIAGPDFGMHEFNEIGHLVETLASDDAFTKIGLVEDANMGDEVQVTVIATGLHRAATRPEPVRDAPGARSDDSVLRVRPEIKLVRSHAGKRNGTTGMSIDALPEADSGHTSASRLLRGHARPDAAAEPPRTALSAHDAYLDTDIDIPAFLRRQAD